MPGVQEVETPDGKAGAANQPEVETFVALLGSHEREIFSYIYALTANWNDAQEVMQRVRIRTWQQFDQYDPAKPFIAWAKAVAYYLVLGFRKERGRQREYFGEKIFELIDATTGTIDNRLSERHEALRVCLAKLTPDQRRLVVDFYARKEPVAAVAAEREMTAGALRQLLFRIRRTLLKCVEQSMSRST